MSKYVPVLRTFDLVLADQLEELFRAEGIHFKRYGGSAALLGAGPSAVEQRIEVAPEDLSHATDLLGILGSSHPADSDSHLEETADKSTLTGPARFRSLVPGLTRTWLFACAAFVLAVPAVWLFAEARRWLAGAGESA